MLLYKKIIDYQKGKNETYPYLKIKISAQKLKKNNAQSCRKYMPKCFDKKEQKSCYLLNSLVSSGSTPSNIKGWQQSFRNSITTLLREIWYEKNHNSHKNITISDIHVKLGGNSLLGHHPCELELDSYGSELLCSILSACYSIQHVEWAPFLEVGLSSHPFLPLKFMNK